MSALWSPQQHAWLKALGHTVYRQGAMAVETAEASADAGEPAAVVSVPTRRRPESAPEAARVADPPSRRANPRLPDRLHFALIRASGCNPNAEDAAPIIAQWPASSELHGNPAAKRALWPQLRKLRRPRSP